MTALFCAALFALFVGVFCLMAYGETGNETQLILAIINFGLAIVDFIVCGLN